MHRSSPPRIVPDWSKDTVTAAEDVSAATFVNLERSTIRHEDGFARGEYAILPEKAEYDRIRVTFGVPTLTDVSTASLAVWAKGSDGNAYLLGSSELGADGLFPAIEFPNHQATYALVVASAVTAGGAGAEVSVDAFVQGIFETLAVAG